MRFYVYRLFDVNETTLYVGKGSGRRLETQIKSHKAHGGEIIERFKLERAAYKRERELIKELAPLRNRHPGGNGSRATPIRKPRRYDWEIEMERIGTRQYAANMLARFGIHVNYLAN